MSKFQLVFSEIARNSPMNKDFNHIQHVSFIPSMDPANDQHRHSQITQQYSSSTDEGCDTDHGEMDECMAQPTSASTSSVPAPMQRLNSYASSSSSSGVVINFHSKSLSQNLCCESSRSNFSTFESLDLNLSDCSDLASSLPSCATTVARPENDTKDNGELTLCIVILMK